MLRDYLSWFCLWVRKIVFDIFSVLFSYLVIEDNFSQVKHKWISKHLFVKLFGQTPHLVGSGLDFKKEEIYIKPEGRNLRVCVYWLLPKGTLEFQAYKLVSVPVSSRAQWVWNLTFIPSSSIWSQLDSLASPGVMFLILDTLKKWRCWVGVSIPVFNPSPWEVEAGR